MHRSFLWLIFLGCLVVIPSDHAWADGKVFSQVVAAPVTVPDQRAMLYYSNGLERLVIETSFVGQGTNFAWVVPLPSAPTIQAVSTNFFRALDYSFRPTLIDKGSPWWFLFALFGMLFISIARHDRKVGCLGCLASSVAMFILILILLPALGPFGCGPSATAPVPTTVQVIARGQVGVYDTAVLSASDGSDLSRWLNSQGFFTPTSALPVISSYATQHWVFAAAKVNRANNATRASQPHPLAFTFQTEQPVYPMRLTGVENDTCTVELFVFGPERAEAPGFRVEHCGRPWLTKSNDMQFSPPAPGSYRIHKPELRDFVMPAPVTTKLVGKLKPKQMQSDAWIRWVPFESKLPVYYSDYAAFTILLNWFMGVSITGGAVLYLLSRKWKMRAGTFVCVWTSLFVAALICGFVRTSLIQTTRVERVPRRFSEKHDWEKLNKALTNYVHARQGLAPLAFAELQTNFDAVSYDAPLNAFTGTPLSNTPNPGNITLQPRGNDTEVWWYDIEGVGHVMATFPKAAP